ncbi:MAG: hyaluronate lyase [Desulfuromonas sp.]|nr:MAG: hyaluronate lyase [Desulfuromonas sp.]
MLNRREFLKRCRDISIFMCGSTLLTRSLAHGFLHLVNNPPALAFIHAQNCMGCTTSMMYGNDFDFVDFLSHVGRLEAHPSLSFRQGGGYLEHLQKTVSKGDAVLVVEGSIPSTPPEACYLGDKPLFTVLKDYLKQAHMVISSGSCASHGGIPASGASRTGAMSVTEYMEKFQIDVPHVRIPGCPAHPDHLMGTIAYIAATGKVPPFRKFTDYPREYFGELIHNRCSRHQNFSQDLFVNDFSKDKHACLLKKGCRGPITASDCSTRHWNQRTNVCIESNTPCIGCMNPDWPFESALYLDTSEVEDLPWSEMKRKVKQRR